jgi:hypothetical protein
MIKGFEPVPRATPSTRYTSKERDDMGKQAAKIISYNAQIKELRNDPKNKDLSYVLEDKKKVVISNLMKLGLNLDEIADMVEYQKSLK